MFIGRNFWKSSLLEFEKSEISLSSPNVVISLIDLMARSCTFPFRCFLAFWIVWKQSNRLCIWLFTCSRQTSMLTGSSLGNSAKRALGTRNPCHRQYTSNSHLPIGAKFLKQQSAQNKFVDPSVGSSKRTRVQSTTENVPHEDMHEDPKLLLLRMVMMR